MSKPDLVSISEFARRVGVTEAAVRKGVKNGRVVISPGNKIDAATQADRWERTRDPSKITTGIGKGSIGRPATASTPEASDAAEGYGRLKTANLALDLRIKQEEYRRLTGELVERSAIKSALTSYSRLIRDKTTNFGNRYGAEIAAEIGADPKLVMAALEKFMRIHLDEIANTNLQSAEFHGGE